jgi:hypothetical protein
MVHFRALQEASRRVTFSPMSTPEQKCQSLPRVEHAGLHRYWYRLPVRWSGALPAGAAPPASASGRSNNILSQLRKLFPCGPAPHISDHRLAAVVHMHMLDADGLRAAFLRCRDASPHNKKPREKRGQSVVANGVISDSGGRGDCAVQLAF